MKRGFLFGLGSFFVLGVLGGLEEALRDGNGWFGCTLTINGKCHGVAGGMIVIALSVPLSVLAIWKANAAAPNKSRLHAVGGWLIGFGFIPVVIPLTVIVPFLAVIAIVQFINSVFS